MVSLNPILRMDKKAKLTELYNANKIQTKNKTVTGQK